jgi:hypothetical protein
MSTSESFAVAVRREFAFLTVDHGFQVTEEDRHRVRLESPTLVVEAFWDPRGEVAVRVSRRGHEDWAESWNFEGMVGRATVSRLLQMAGEQMRAEAPVLLGDAAYYATLSAEQNRSAQEWTAYYSGRGPRPRSGKLPLTRAEATQLPCRNWH